MRFGGLKRRTNRNRPVCSPRQRHQTDMTAYDLLLELGVIDDPYARNKERD